jgi:DNA invertase Pin-like site-specific DNA recombinase
MVSQFIENVKHESFIALQDIARYLVQYNGLAIYPRVSTPSQRHSLFAQEDELIFSACKYAGYFNGFMVDSARINPSHIFREIHSGTTFDRPAFQRCIEFAKQNRLIVCAHSIDRLVRHPDFCPHYDRTPRPKPEQIQELVSYGVTFALEIPFTATSEEIRSAETRRGRKLGKRGGNPKPSLSEIAEIQSMRAYMSIRDIAKLTKKSKSAIERMLKVSQTVPFGYE